MRKHITFLACLLLICPVLASAQMMGPGGGMGSGGGMGPGGGMAYGGWGSGGGKYYAGGCDYQLTPEQQKAYGEIVEKYRPDFNKLAETMWAKRAQLNAVLAQEKIDSKQAGALAEELGQLAAKAYVQRVQMLVDMREQGISFYGMGMMGGGMMGGPMMGGGMMGAPWHHGNMPGYGYGNQTQ